MKQMLLAGSSTLRLLTWPTITPAMAAAAVAVAVTVTVAVAVAVASSKSRPANKQHI